MKQFLALIASVFFTVTTVYSQMLPVDDRSLVISSDLIIQAKIEEATIQWVDSPKFIFTLYPVVVENVFKGSVQENLLPIVVVPGGYDRDKDIGLFVSEQAEFSTGESVVLFLRVADGEYDGINYQSLNKYLLPTKAGYRVNSFLQGKRKIYLDKQLNIMMVNKPNDGKSVELQSHHEQLKQLIEELDQSR
jgi:hypothetical protein